MGPFGSLKKIELSGFIVGTGFSARVGGDNSFSHNNKKKIRKMYF